MTDYAAIEAEIRRELARSSGANDAMTRLVAILKERIPDYTWVGVYQLHDNELRLGPYLGKPSPHTHIPLARGICGAAATARQTIVVDDVNSDERYLACSLETQSEIVVPVMRNGHVLAEIDVDSDRRAAFGQKDRELLEAAAAILAEKL
jgi:L-methionine (R)-S-oxide reductase